MCRWLLKCNVKSLGLTQELHYILGDLSAERASGTPSVAVECVDIWKNNRGEGGLLGSN